MVRRPRHPLAGLADRVRRCVLAPGQGDEPPFAGLDERASRGRRALEADVEVAGQAKLEVRSGPCGDRVVVAGSRVAPFRGSPSVVEHRRAVHANLDLAINAAHRAEQHMVGVVVRRRPAMRRRALSLVMPVSDQQAITDDQPAAGRPPARLEQQRSGNVPAGGRYLDARGADPEGAGVAIERGAEHTRRVHPGQAHPLHASARGDERGDLAVRQEAVIGDRWERRRSGTIGR